MKFLTFLLALTLAACSPAKPVEADGPRPALWELSGPGREKAWIFGTIHSLPKDLVWDSGSLDQAVRDSSNLVLEISNADDDPAARDTFLKLGTTPGLAPLDQRVRPDLRDELRDALGRTRLDPAQFTSLEDWAAALTLSVAVEEHSGYASEHGADRALLAKADGRKVLGLETMQGQLGVFDRLPAPAQTALLNAVVEDSDDPGESAKLVKAWSTGDIEAIAKETYEGMLADATLREALLVNRNRQWAERIDAMVRQGRRPFVAVGAAHVAGSDGLPALLEAKGWTIKRIQ